MLPFLPHTLVVIILLFSSFFGYLGLRVTRSAWAVLHALDPCAEPDDAPVVTVVIDKAPHAKGVCMGLDRRRSLKQWRTRVTPESMVQPSS